MFMTTHPIQKFDVTGFRSLFREVLAQDIGAGNLTTIWTVPEHARSSAVIRAKESGIIAGLGVAEEVLKLVDPSCSFEYMSSEGEAVQPGSALALMGGSARSLLTAERTVLNFLQRMSGIATYAAELCAAVADTGVVIVDTRKTAPGLRFFDKYSVIMGGAKNHRMGLYDVVLIKENHIAVAGGVASAIRRVRDGMMRESRDVKVEIEVTNQDQFREAADAGVDLVLLDNMHPDELHSAARFANGIDESSRPVLEASGNVTRENIRRISETGVDRISVGALTHSVKALDLSMLVESA